MNGISLDGEMRQLQKVSIIVDEKLHRTTSQINMKYKDQFLDAVVKKHIQEFLS